MPEKPESLKDVFENLKKDGTFKSFLTYEELQARREQEDIERGKFELEPAKNPQKKTFSERYPDIKDEKDKEDFIFAMGLDQDGEPL